jgi:hypothetical protein
MKLNSETTRMCVNVIPCHCLGIVFEKRRGLGWVLSKRGFHLSEVVDRPLVGPSGVGEIRSPDRRHCTESQLTDLTANPEKFQQLREILFVTVEILFFYSSQLFTTNNGLHDSQPRTRLRG